MSKKHYRAIGQALGEHGASEELVEWFSHYFAMDNGLFQMYTFKEHVRKFRKKE